MYLLDDDIYYETKNIVLGNIQRSPMLVEFSDWYMETYAIKVLNINFRKLNDKERNIYRLRVIIKDDDEITKISDNQIQLIKEVPLT